MVAPTSDPGENSWAEETLNQTSPPACGAGARDVPAQADPCRAPAHPLEKRGARETVEWYGALGPSAGSGTPTTRRITTTAATAPQRPTLAPRDRPAITFGPHYPGSGRKNLWFPRRFGRTVHDGKRPRPTPAAGPRRPRPRLAIHATPCIQGVSSLGV